MGDFDFEKFNHNHTHCIHDVKTSELIFVELKVLEGIHDIYVHCTINDKQNVTF